MGTFKHNIGEMPSVVGLKFTNFLIVLVATVCWFFALVIFVLSNTNYFMALMISGMYCALVVSIYVMQNKFGGSFMSVRNRIKYIRPRMSEIQKLFETNRKRF